MNDRGADGSGARILDGNAIATEILEEAAVEFDALRAAYGSVPGIRVVMIGDDPASSIYARRILKTAQRVGATGEMIKLDAAAGAETLAATLRSLSGDDTVGGVILQLPLPADLEARGLIEQLDPAKDLDGIHPYNAGLVSRGESGIAPSCPEAALQILKRSGVSLKGRPVVVVGRSNVVGKPAQSLLLREDATVTVCHRQTRNLQAQLRSAEIVVVAAGMPGLVRGDAIQPGAVVIDCGINVLADGTMTGDVDLPSVLPVASAVTPVPGGVGPVTNAVLMEHLASASRALLEKGTRSAVRMAS